MGVIARGAKAGGGTNLNSGQANDPAEVNTDFNTIVTEVNGLLDDANIETATIPGAKSLRFTEIAAPGSPAANDIVLYGFDVGGTTVLAAKDSAGAVVDVSGRIGAALYNSAPQSIPNNTVTALTLDGNHYSVGGGHSANHFVAPIAGKYLATGTVLFAADTDLTRMLAYLYASTGPVTFGAYDVSVPYTTGAGAYLCVAGIWTLAASGSIDLQVYHFNTSAGANLVSGTLYVHYLGS